MLRPLEKLLSRHLPGSTVAVLVAVLVAAVRRLLPAPLLLLFSFVFVLLLFLLLVGEKR